MTSDWSDDHVVFAATQDVPTRIANQSDPRYRKQRDRRQAKYKGFDNYNLRVPLESLNRSANQSRRNDDDDDNSSSRSANLSVGSANKGGNRAGTSTPGKPQGDWSITLGDGGAVVAPGQFPAKFSFDINAAPSCTDDFVVFGVNRTGATPVAASRNGTVNSTNGTGSISVNGTALTASTGNAASRTGTFTGFASSGNTVTITNGGNTLTLTAGAVSTGTLTFSGAPANSGTVTVGSVTYTFISGSSSSNFVSNCGSIPNCVRTSTNTSDGATYLAAALTDGAIACGVTSCYANLTPNQANASVSASNSGGVITVANITGGSISFSESATNFAASPSGGTLAAGTSNGCSSSTTGTFVIGSSASTQGTNLAAAIVACGSSFPAIGVTASGTTTVTVTALTAGTAGNSISLAELTNNFTWAGANLTGGSNANNTGTNFATNDTTASIAANIAAAINRNVSTVTATSNTNTVTVTANTAGAAGNSITTTESTSWFTWAGSTLTGGADGQPSIVSFNNIYAGPAVAAKVTGTASSNGISAGQTITIGSLTLTAAAPVRQVSTLYTSSGITNSGTLSDLLQIGSVHYLFANDSTLPTPAANTCNIHTNNSTTTARNNLIGAITNGASGSSGSSSTWRCASGTTPNPSISSTITGSGTSGDPWDLTAATAGSTGFTITDSSTGITTSTTTSGSNGNNTGTNFIYWNGASAASASQLATNIVSAINRVGNGSSVGVSAGTVSGGAFTLSATTGGAAGNSITVASSATGFAWDSSSLRGGIDDGICGTGNATVMWSYNTASTTGGGSAGPVSVSPALSLDGRKVVYIENRPSGGAVLHVLRWKSGQGTALNPAVPDHTIVVDTAGVIQSGSCPEDGSSCDFQLVYSASSNTRSSPFPNYSTDAVYVGDDSGTIAKISPLFGGNPARIWTQSVGVSTILTGPVFGFGNNRVYVGDASGGMTYLTDNGGSASSATRVSPGTSTFSSIVDPPIVDTDAGVVTFLGTRTSGGARVIQRNLSLASNLVSVQLGGASLTPSASIRVGAFTDAYFSSGSPSAKFYICGYSSGNTAPFLYRLDFHASTSGLLAGTSTGMTALSSTTSASCSPLTSILNGDQGKEWLFVGVNTSGSCSFTASDGSSTSGGCMMAFDITGNAAPSTPDSVAVSPGGSSGIVVDNVSSSGHASSIYYSTGSTATCTDGNNGAGCAVHRTQMGLQ
ncbi:MAG: hypothetical protein ABL967_09300 [Bryobacteraceae bacterium]